MTDKIKGVNLGAWLVLEKWMTPRLFEGTPSEDEYYLAQDVEKTVYEAKIKTHRDEFITEGDFVKIAAAGFNMVRIPVPYFIFGDRPPFIGCVDELDRAFNWAEASGLRILIDLHTSPYNQNAFDNGGISGVCKWAQHPEEVDFVLSVLMRLAGRYKARNGLWGIEILNEPLTPKMWNIIKPQEQFPPRDEAMAEGSAPISFDFLYDFYKKAYNELRMVLPSDKVIVFHDGFDLSAWKDFFQEQNFDNVMLDTHHYLVFDKDPSTENLKGYTAHLKQLGEQINEVSQYVPVVTGEWSLFNHFISKLTPNPIHAKDPLERAEQEAEIKAFYESLWEASVSAWNKGEGYFYWTYKLNIDTVNEPEKVGMDCWDLSRALAKGWGHI
ncbi:cellulase family glycosylhydrolase [Alkalibacterium psychrotolerans]